MSSSAKMSAIAQGTSGMEEQYSFGLSLPASTQMESALPFSVLPNNGAQPASVHAVTKSRSVPGSTSHHDNEGRFGRVAPRALPFLLEPAIDGASNFT